MNLHSNMVLFKFYITTDEHNRIIFTFQYGSIQMISKKTARAVLFWFTFQYGSIQMELELRELKASDLFTFQYGSIQISLTIFPHCYSGYLHSNMVLFK